MSKYYYCGKEYGDTKDDHGHRDPEPEYYRLIPKTGSHLANSKNTEGAVRGIFLGDETEKVSGSAEFMPVSTDYLKQRFGSCEFQEEKGLSPETRECLEIIADGLTNLVIWGCEEYIFPAAGRFWKQSVKPAVGRKVSSAKEWFTVLMNPEEPKLAQIMAAQRTETASKTDTSVLMLEQSYERYTTDMTSEEAKRELIEVFFLSVELASRIKRLRYARIIDGENPGQYISGEQLVERLTSPEYIRCVNRILASDPETWREQMTAFGDITGQEKIQIGKFVPVNPDVLRNNLR